MPKPVLEPYQEICKNFIIEHPKCGVFLNIGYGKTLTTLQAIDELRPRNVLVIAPKTIARTTWDSEVRKWGYDFETYSMVEKTNLKTKKKTEIPTKNLLKLYGAICRTHPGTVNIFITTRDRVEHLVKWCDANNNWPFDMVVCDEFQSFKNFKSNRSKAVRLLAQHTRRLVGLTGTPMPNTVEDLFGEMLILDNGTRLGRYVTHFREKYMRATTRTPQGYPAGWVAKEGAEDAIFSKISDITISVKTDLKLPPLTIQDIPVKLTDDELNMYKNFARKGVLNLEEIDEFAAFKPGNDDAMLVPSTAAVLASKLLQMASGIIYDDHKNPYEIHNQKIAALQYIIDNAFGPVLVAYNFAYDEERLLKNLRVEEGEKIVKFDGTNEMKEAWNRGEYKVMLLQPASSCHGVNLQDGGCTLVWYSLSYSYEHYEQTNGRLYRKGQKKPVMIYRLIASDTFDEKVAKVLGAKEHGNAALLEAVRRELLELRS